MDSFNHRRYQVFVSSTFNDLQEERRKVLQAVLELRAFPAGMEMFPSADEEQWEFIKREIESSDYYVVVVAGKYGSLAESGASYTENEYDYAIRLGKPVMAFVAADLDDLRGSQLEIDPERRAQLLSFHEKVKRGKLVKFYRNADDLKALVLQALFHAFQVRPQEGWVRAKNARRLEDLEELARAHRQVQELQAENAKLREKSSDWFGDQTEQWRLELREIVVDKAEQQDDGSSAGLCLRLRRRPSCYGQVGMGRC